MEQESAKEKTTAVKATEAAKKVRGIVKGLSNSAHMGKAEGKLVAYTFIQSLYDEILKAMDIVPVWIENYAGLCAAKRDADRFIDKADAEGYTRSLCTYCTLDLGFDALRKELGESPPAAPDGGMTEPDMMLGTGMMICDPRYTTFIAAQRYNDAPAYVHGLLWPPYDAKVSEVRDHYMKYVVEELKGLVAFLEKQTGRKMDWDKLNAIIDIANETLRTWAEVDEIRKAVPSPMPTQDAMNIMVPATFLLGTQEALDFYRALRDEVKHRADNKIGVIENEKYRVLWGAGLPPWHSLRIYNYFESLGAVFPIEVGYRTWAPVNIPSHVTHPLERLAWRFFNQQTYRYEKAQKHTGDPNVELLLDLIDDYKIDGVVMHRVFTCRTAHVGLMHQLRLLKEYVGLPQLLLEGDIVDARLFSEADTNMKINAFIEAVNAYKNS